MSVVTMPDELAKAHVECTKKYAPEKKPSSFIFYRCQCAYFNNLKRRLEGSLYVVEHLIYERSSYCYDIAVIRGTDGQTLMIAFAEATCSLRRSSNMHVYLFHSGGRIRRISITGLCASNETDAISSSHTRSRRPATQDGKKVGASKSQRAVHQASKCDGRIALLMSFLASNRHARTTCNPSVSFMNVFLFHGRPLVALVANLLAPKMPSFGLVAAGAQYPAAVPRVTRVHDSVVRTAMHNSMTAPEETWYGHRLRPGFQ